MAANLIKGGHTLFTHTLGPTPQSLTDAGATKCASGEETARQADIIIVMVPDTPDVEAALFGQNGVAGGLAKAKTVIAMSSIWPVATKEFARRITELGYEYLDAPVSGGEVGAKAARLTIRVGGTQAAFARIQPPVELIGRNETRVGG